ncbi:NAD-dependent epimerase/dehydratase family protein [Phreatobacter stygius]|uniref:NAD-dependent epimerase/dehydratase family protein n=1 Tax=Phreatobacter stygius TaxID=1940610 RepID=UPI001477706F|nr:NAD-dependent epimerase/dehydratase family protein [Phreatobacter stygius]
MLIVTGATGLLGNTLVRRALGRGLQATALLRDKSATRPLDGLAVRIIRADLAGDALEPLVAGARCVIHAGARVAIGRRDLEAFRVDNVVPTARLAAACRAAGVRLVFVSTVDTLAWGSRAAPGDETRSSGREPATAYSISKREAEDAVLAEVALGLDAVIVHPGFLLGPWDWKPSSGRLILEVARAPFALAPPGGNDFCHAADVADGVLAAAERAVSGSRYVLSGEALSYAEAFRLIRRAAGRTPRIATAPAWLVAAAGRAGDLIGAVSGREPALNSASAAIVALPHHLSSALAARDLGYRPRPAEIAMRDAWTWFTGHGYA